MTVNSVDKSEQYAALLKEVMVLQRQLLDARVQRALAAMAKVKNKSRYLRELENAISLEMATHRRACKLDAILDMIEDLDDVRKHIVW